VDDLLPIGTMAKRTGLTVRALRLYDGVGLLRPADVDPATGYRRYAEQQVAQGALVARLRDADVPLPMVAVILAEPDGPSRRRLLDEWWAHREDAVARQRDLVAAVGRLLEETRMTTTHRIDAAALADALTAVLRCTSDEHELPVITGVLLEPTDTGLRLVATDKYRLAIWDLPSHGEEAIPAIVDATAFAGLLDHLGQDHVTIELSEDAVILRADDGPRPLGTIPGTYPAYRGLLPTTEPVGTVTLDRLALRSVLAGSAETVRLDQDDAGLLIDGTVVAARCVDTMPTVHVRKAYLVDGIDALGPAKDLTLAVWSPLHPILITADGVPGQYLLMPVRVDEPAPA
jgi:DNA polymerase-3 subunit beta